jgi:hypothetical protein
MSTKRRLARRTYLDRQAWVSLNSERSPVDCTVADISEIGAKIVVKLNMEIPQEFDLLLTADGAVRRRCVVVWQSSDEIGLTFIGRKASRAAVGDVALSGEGMQHGHRQEQDAGNRREQAPGAALRPPDALSLHRNSSKRRKPQRAGGGFTLEGAEHASAPCRYENPAAALGGGMGEMRRSGSMERSLNRRADTPFRPLSRLSVAFVSVAAVAAAGPGPDPPGRQDRDRPPPASAIPAA